MANESVINSYLREIEALTRENKQLKKINDSLNKEKKDSFIETNPSKEAAQQNICKIINRVGKDSLSKLEEEFLALDYTRKGEINYEMFTKVLTKFGVELANYEIQNVFNNFRRSSVNSISYYDFISVLKVNAPSAYVFQPDPEYIKDMEKRLVDYETRLKAKEEIVLGLENKLDSAERASMVLRKEHLDEKEKLIKEIHLIEAEKEDAVKRINTWEVGGTKTGAEVKKLKEKIKMQETIYRDKTADLEHKYAELLSDKIDKESIRKLEDRLEKVREERDKLKAEVTEERSKSRDLERKIEEKTQKYKRKINRIKSENKVEEVKIDRDDAYEVIREKLEHIDSRKRQGEEYYKRLSVTANHEALAKEFERMKRAFTKERRQLEQTIVDKNKELSSLKDQFEEIIRELDQGKRRR